MSYGNSQGAFIASFISYCLSTIYAYTFYNREKKSLFLDCLHLLILLFTFEGRDRCNISEM